MLLHVSETVKQGNQAIININFCLGVWFKAMILLEFPSGAREERPQDTNACHPVKFSSLTIPLQMFETTSRRK